MLNTESQATAGLIWLAITALVLKFVWTLLALPAPADAAAMLAASPLADWLVRNQLMVTGLAGFGGLALAYLLNGWRDRAEQRHVVERSERRLAAVLERETTQIADRLDEAGRTLTQGRSSGAARSRIAEAVDPRDCVVLSAGATDLARLGPGAVTAIADLRRSARRLAAMTATPDEVADRPLADAASETSRVARTASLMLETYQAKGPAAADRLRILPAGPSAMPALEAQPSARLLPAA